MSFSCEKCDHQYNDKNALKYHIQSKHEGKRYSCEKSEYEAGNPQYLKEHTKIVFVFYLIWSPRTKLCH